MWFCFTQSELGLLNQVIHKHHSNQFHSKTHSVIERDVADFSSAMPYSSEVLVQPRGGFFCSRNKIHNIIWMD